MIPEVVAFRDLPDIVILWGIHARGMTDTLLWPRVVQGEETKVLGAATVNNQQFTLANIATAKLDHQRSANTLPAGMYREMRVGQCTGGHHYTVD